MAYASRLLSLSFLLASSCATSKPDTSPAQPAQVAAASDGAEERYHPGGMWMPAQMSQHADALKRLGLAYPAENLTDPTAFPLGAVVSLGGCSASFVSPDGLIVTNHHCVTGALQYSAKKGANLLTDGYLARSRGDEKWAGPTQRVYVTTAQRDVTKGVLDGLDKIADAKARYEAIESRVKQLTAACEAGKPDTRCRIASYYEGAQFHEIEQLEIRDVRLVYAPAAGVGVYGGEIDNWRWPRHTGDFSFLRAYVGKDQKPADHAKDNVPYQPPHHLKLASQPLEAGDLVMVAGYPGRTYRLKTAAEVETAVNLEYPHRIEMFEEYIALLEELGKDDEEVRIKAASRMRGLSNYLTNYKGMLDGLVKGGLADRKRGDEADLRAYIKQEADRQARYGGVLEEMDKLQAAEAATYQRDTAAAEVLRGSALLQAAGTIVELAQEREKPDADRKPQFQERNWKRLTQGSIALSSRYDARMDRAVFEMFLARAAKLPDGERPDELLRLVAGVKGEAVPTAKQLGAAVDRFYRKTKLGDEAARVKLLDKASVASLRKSKDPFIKLALALHPMEKAERALAEERAGKLATLRPKYIAALLEFLDRPIAPDANSTLRITYGTVRGYRATPDADPYVPFTTLEQMVAKHTGQEPFNAPANILAVAKAGNLGPYVSESVGDVPVNFLADLDITGGNSGSATLNAKGELVGLVFDGNYESIASDWLFIPELTRSIHVDLRYMMWVMDGADGADWLLEEMGATPAI